MVFERDIIDALIDRYPELSSSTDSITAAAEAVASCYERGGKLLICGNGGSASDSSHIAGELMKGFLKDRLIDKGMKDRLEAADAVRGRAAGNMLQTGFPAIPLNAFDSLITAISNDMDSRMVFAQQIMALGKKGDILLGITTSGNSENIIFAAVTAMARGMKILGLTGKTGGLFKTYCDICITVPETDTAGIQELHVPVYHALCALVEAWFFP